MQIAFFDIAVAFDIDLFRLDPVPARFCALGQFAFDGCADFRLAHVGCFRGHCHFHIFAMGTHVAWPGHTEIDGGRKL